MQDHSPPPAPGRRLSVLVAEDEFLIAMDVEMMLVENGHTVLGPVTSINAALNLLKEAKPEAAVLDVNLCGQLITPVAERLQGLKVPFVLASAYDSGDFDGCDILEGAEKIRKPYRERCLLEALDRAAAIRRSPRRLRH